MYQKEKWAAVIASIFLAASLVVGFPVLYPAMTKILNLPFLTDPAALIREAQEALIPMKYDNELDDIENAAVYPEGILYVSNERANIRSTPEVANGNVIGQTTAGNYLLYFGAEQVYDGSIWYHIQNREDLSEGWIGGSTVQVAATSDNTVEDMESVEEFVGQYLQAVIKSVESYNFTIVEPYLLPTGVMYEEQRNYLTYLSEQQIKEELLAYRVIDALTLADGQIWVRTIEFYDITYSDGSVARKDFISEYVFTVVGEGEYQVNRLLGTYQQNL